MTARMYINTTCKVGQSEPCGKPAAWVISVTEVADTSWATDGRAGGVVALCEFHATTPVAEWDATPDEEPGARTKRIRDLVERSSFGTPEAKAARASVSDERVARVVKRATELRESRAPWVHRFLALDDSDECGICGMSADEQNHHDLSLFEGEDS